MQVGDSVSCFVFDVENGQPMLTQRLPEDADDDFAAIAGELLGSQAFNPNLSAFIRLCQHKKDSTRQPASGVTVLTCATSNPSLTSIINVDITASSS